MLRDWKEGVVRSIAVFCITKTLGPDLSYDRSADKAAIGCQV